LFRVNFFLFISKFEFDEFIEIKFLKVPPKITLNIYDNNGTGQSLTGDIIGLLKNNLYVFQCSAYSNPGVSLSLYNKDTKKYLSNKNNTISSLACNSYGIGCTAIISVTLDFTNSQFSNMTSVTCLATSLNSTNEYLTANLTQNIAVLQTGALKTFL